MLFDDQLVQKFVMHVIQIYYKRYYVDWQYIYFYQKVNYLADAFYHCLALKQYEQLLMFDEIMLDNVFMIILECVEEYENLR